MKVHILITDETNNSYEGTAELQKIKNTKKRIREKINVVKGAADILKKLYLEKYFEKTRTIAEVTNKINNMKYNFDRHSIAMALSRAKYLSRGGKSGSYTYIQKTPP